MTIPPFGTGYPSSDRSTFFEKLRQKRLQEQKRQEQRLAVARENQQAARDAQRIKEQYEQNNVATQLGPVITPTPGQYIPVPPSTAKDTYVKNLNTSNPQMIDYGTFFGSGVLENITEAGITTLGKLEPAIQTAVGLGASLIPGEQEFDKQLREIVKEREEAGKTAGLRGLFASRTEAARRADSLQRGSEYIASVGLSALPDNLFFSGIETDALNAKRKRYFEEYTGEKWTFGNSLKYFTDDLRATRQAYLEVEQPKFVKGTLEFFGDPINLLSGGTFAEITAATKIVKAASMKSLRLAQKPFGYQKIMKGDNTIDDNFKAGRDVTDPEVKAEMEDRIIFDVPNGHDRIVPPLEGVDVVQKYRNVKKSETKLNISSNALFQKVKDDIAKTSPDKLVRLIKQGDKIINHLGLGTIGRHLSAGARLVTPRFVANASTDSANVRNLETFMTILEADMASKAAASSNLLTNKIGFFNDVFKTGAQQGNKGFDYIEEVGDGTLRFNANFNKRIVDEAIKAEKSQIKFMRDRGIKVDDITEQEILTDIQGVNLVGQRIRKNKIKQETPLHESTIATALVTFKQTAGNPNKYIVDLNPAFKKSNNMFYDKTNDKITKLGDYFIQKSAYYQNMANSLEQFGKPITVKRTVRKRNPVTGKLEKNPITKEQILEQLDFELSGVNKAKYLQVANGHVSRKAYWDATLSSSNKYEKVAGYNNANDKIGKYTDEYRKSLQDAEDLYSLAGRGEIKYLSPEDALNLATQAHFHQISQIVRKDQYTKLFLQNPALREQYKLTVAVGNKAPEIGLFDIRTNIATGKTKVYEIKKQIKKQTPVEETDEFSRVYDQLFFQDRRLAEDFARKAGILLEADGRTLADLKSVGAMSDTFKRVLLGETGKTVLDFPAKSIKTVTSGGRLFGTGIDIAGSFLYGMIFFGKANSEILKGVRQGDKARVGAGLGIAKTLASAQSNAFRAFLGKVPKIGKDTRKISQEIWSPDKHASIKRAAQSGVIFNKQTIETFELINSNSILNVKGVNKIFKPFENIWRNSIDEIKIGTWDALTKHLDPTNPAHATQMREIAEFINKGMGTLDSASRGVGRAQRDIESAYLFFSPRMTRSIIALLGDAVTMGGKQGQLAREGAIGGFAALNLYTYAIGQALGQEVNLNPMEKNYLQIKIGDTSVGPGGQIVSLPRAAFRLAAGPDDTDALYQETDVNGDYRDQPWFKFIRSRAFSSPGGSMLLEAVTGQNYFGEDYEGVGDFTLAQTGRLLPFWASGIADSAFDEAQYTSALGGAFEFGGLRTAPETVWSSNKQLLEDATRLLYPDSLSYKELDPIAKKLLREELAKEEGGFFSRENVPGGTEILEDYQKTNRIMENERSKNNQDTNKINEFYDELERINTLKETEKQTMLSAYKDSRQNTRDRRQMIQELNAKYAPDYDRLYDPRGEYTDVLNYLTRLDTSRGLESPESTWITTYKNQVLYNDDFDMVSVDNIEYFDYARQEQTKTEWINKYGTEAFEYVRQYFAVTQDLEPDEKELKDAREYFSYYWDATELAAIEDTARQFNTSKEIIENLIYSLPGLTEDQRAGFRKFPEIRFYEKRRKNIQEELRKNNQGLDGFIYRWNYSDTLLHPKNEGSETFWTDKRGIDLTNPNHLYFIYNNN